MKIRIATILTVVLSTWFAQFSLAQSEDERALYDAQFKSRDAEGLRKAADQGNAKAQGLLGLLYLHGTGVEKDIPQAVELLRKAADQGDARGQILLGSLYAQGTGVEQDLPQAIEYLRKAADQGQWAAQVQLCACWLQIADDQIKAQELAQAMRSIEEVEKCLPAASTDPTGLSNQIGDLSPTHVAALQDTMTKIKQALPALRRQAQGGGNSPSVAEIGAMFDGASQKLNSKANVEDREPEKFGGPDTQTVIRLANLGFATAGDPSMVMTIKRGQPLVANELSEIPAGTKVFPIRIKTGLVDFDYSFYLDPFEEWQMQSPRGSGGFGMEPVN